jgi:hypothetical protein
MKKNKEISNKEICSTLQQSNSSITRRRNYIKKNQNFEFEIKYDSNINCCKKNCNTKLPNIDNQKKNEIIKNYTNGNYKNKKISIWKFKKLFFERCGFECCSILIKSIFKCSSDILRQVNEISIVCGEEEAENTIKNENNGENSNKKLTQENVDNIKKFLNNNFFSSPTSNFLIGPSGITSWKKLTNNYNITVTPPLKQISHKTMKNYFDLIYNNCNYKWLSKSSSACSTCFKLFVENENLNQEIKNLNNEIKIIQKKFNSL